MTFTTTGFRSFLSSIRLGTKLSARQCFSCSEWAESEKCHVKLTLDQRKQRSAHAGAEFSCYAAIDLTPRTLVAHWTNYVL